MVSYLDEQLLYYVNYANGKKNGVELIYYKSGGYRILNYYEHDDLTYRCFFYRKGNIYEEVGYKSNKKHGRFAQYYKNGQVMFVTNFDLGEQSSDEIYFKKNGKVDIIFEVKNGVFTGETSK